MLQYCEEYIYRHRSHFNKFNQGDKKGNIY